MTDYTYTDYNWCPDCGLPRGVCTCDSDQRYIDDDHDPAEDLNVCPVCGADTTYYDDWIYCTDTNECGYSEYVGDEEGDAP